MKKRNLFKLAALTAVFALGSMFANAQNPTPVPAVKLIDNKGTIKYLQSDNGLTTVSTSSPSGGVQVTWKLGGTLMENTYIDVRGNVFGLDSIQLTTVDAATSGTLGLDHAVSPGSGWTLLVRNEATGAIEKMLATDLVQSGHQVYTITEPGQATAGVNVTYASNVYTFTVTGVTLPAFDNVYVYRNGAKLIATIDYAPATSSTFTISVTTDLPIYDNDVIELHYVK